MYMCIYGMHVSIRIFIKIHIDCTCIIMYTHACRYFELQLNVIKIHLPVHACILIAYAEFAGICIGLFMHVSAYLNINFAVHIDICIIVYIYIYILYLYIIFYIYIKVVLCI